MHASIIASLAYVRLAPHGAISVTPLFRHTSDPRTCMHACMPRILPSYHALPILKSNFNHKKDDMQYRDAQCKHCIRFLVRLFDTRLALKLGLDAEWKNTRK